MLQDCVFHDIAKHLNGATEAKNTKASTHVKSLEWRDLNKILETHWCGRVYLKGRILHLLLQYQTVHPDTGFGLDPCSCSLETVEIFEIFLPSLVSSAWCKFEVY